MYCQLLRLSPRHQRNHELERSGWHGLGVARHLIFVGTDAVTAAYRHASPAASPVIDFTLRRVLSCLSTISDQSPTGTFDGVHHPRVVDSRFCTGAESTCLLGACGNGAKL
jgi:hypothetical protein